MNNVCDRLVSIARWQNQMMSIAILTLLLSLLVPVVWAQNHPDDLTTLGLEELMKIKVACHDDFSNKGMIFRGNVDVK